MPNRMISLERNTNETQIDLTQRNAHILGGVVVVHLHITVAGEH